MLFIDSYCPSIILLSCIAHVLSMYHVVQVVIKTANCILSALANRQFKDFVKELDSEYNVYFSRVRWLSRGRCFQRFYQLQEQIGLLLNDKRQKMNDKKDLC